MDSQFNVKSKVQNFYHKMHPNKRVCVFGLATGSSVLFKILPAGPNVRRGIEQFDDHCVVVFTIHERSTVHGRWVFLVGMCTN